jgi:two-component system response regulator
MDDTLSADAGALASPGRKIILLADDDETLSVLLRHAVRKARVDAHLHVVTNETALASYLCGDGAYQDRSRFPFPSLVLLDVEMPCLGGSVILEAMRAWQLPPAPILMFSDIAPLDVVDRCYELGCEFYFKKPRRFDDLVDFARELGRWWVATDGPPEDWNPPWLVRRTHRSIASPPFPTRSPSCFIESQ